MNGEAHWYLAVDLNRAKKGIEYLKISQLI